MVKKEYDVVIIGAGPAGMVAAGYLEKTGVSVLVLESSFSQGLPLGKV